jgi:hypothetical protein
MKARLVALSVLVLPVIAAAQSPQSQTQSSNCSPVATPDVPAECKADIALESLVIVRAATPGAAPAGAPAAAPNASATPPPASAPPVIALTEQMEIRSVPPTRKELVVSRHDDGGLTCPTGCGDVLRLQIVETGTPHPEWRFKVVVSEGTGASAVPFIASDGPIRSFVVALPEGHGSFTVAIDVSREDFGGGVLTVRASIVHEPLESGRSHEFESTGAKTASGAGNSDVKKNTKKKKDKAETTGWFVKALADGAAARRWISDGTYSALRLYGRCSVSHGAHCEEQKGFADLYPEMSRILGRSPTREALPDVLPGKSEPIVVFVGLDGDTSILMLDCRGYVNEKGQARTCNKFAPAWSTRFERADYFWAVYVEDDVVPYVTNIDLQFRGREDLVDYEEFDPAAARRADAGTLPPRIPVRVAFKRFHARDAPYSVRIGFSREGQGYGLRQWSRTYRRDQGLLGLGGGVMVTGVPSITRKVSVPELYSDGATTPFARGIVVDENPRFTFAFVSLTLPQWRSGSRELSPAKRLRRQLLPDFVGGLQIPSVSGPGYLLGFSWPLFTQPTLSRLSFIGGWSWVKQDTLLSAYRDGQRVPLSSTRTDVSTSGYEWGWVAGLGFTLVSR